MHAVLCSLTQWSQRKTFKLQFKNGRKMTKTQTSTSDRQNFVKSDVKFVKFAPKIISKIAELEFINFGEPATPSGGYFIENLKQCSYLKCSYLKMGIHGNALAVSYFRRRARLRSRAHGFHYSIEKRCSKLGRYVSFNEILYKQKNSAKGMYSSVYSNTSKVCLYCKTSTVDERHYETCKKNAK